MEKFLEVIFKKQVIGTAITILVAYIAFSIVKLVLEKVLSRNKSEYDKKRKRTVAELLKNIFKWAIIAITGIIIMDLFGLNVSSLIASLGIASAVGALSFQDTLKDIISGASIIMDNYYVVGDYVKYNGFHGQIIELGLRSTKIMNFDGEVLILANRNISEVINLSQKTASTLIIAPTAYEAPIEKVEKVLNEIVEEIKTWDTMKKDTAYIGINELKDSCIDYGIRIYCSPGKVWAYKREILKMIKQRYDKNKIKIPYNQLEVHHDK